MEESIKLTENDFDFIHWEKDSVGPERFVVTIDVTSESECNKTKQLILENQGIRQRLENKIKEIQDAQKSIKSKLDKMDYEQIVRHIKPDVVMYEILENTLNEFAVDEQELLAIMKGGSQK